MENELPYENPEAMESELIAQIREKGLDDPESQELLKNWIIANEELIEKSPDPDSRLKFNLVRARMYFQAGCLDESFENYEDALDQAFHEQREDLIQAITREMDEAEATLNQ